MVVSLKTSLLKYVKGEKMIKIGIVMLLVMILGAGIILLPSYRYQINPDGISYISIAEKYSNGDFRHAINSYWGPLLSWLIIPTFWLGIDPILTIKILQIFVVGIIISTTYTLIKRYASIFFATLGSFAAGVISLDIALSGPLTPDLIVAALTLLLVAVLTSQSGKNSMKYQLIVGAIGTALYFSKSVGFFLFIGIWFLWLLSEKLYEKQPLKVAFRRNLLSLLFFFALIMPFIVLISIKSHSLTIGTSGSYNFALIGPQSEGHPMLNRLIPPPNKTAISPWEDISRVPMRSWSPISSLDNLKFFFKNVRNSLTTINKIILLFIWPVFILALLYLFTPSKAKSESKFKFLILSASLLTLLLYIPLFVEARYIIFIYLSSVIGFSLLFGKFSKQFGRRSIPLTLLGLVIIGFVLSTPIKSLLDQRNINKDVYQQSQSLRADIPIGGHVASDDFASLYACYYLNARCYGVVNTENPDSVNQIRNFKIKYLLLLPGPAKKLKELGLQMQHTTANPFIKHDLYIVNNM
jgi:hypothetical protein